MRRILFAAILGGLWCGGTLAGEVSPAFEVAPQAQGARAQTWASAAWAADSKVWLVVWREGYLNEPETGTDIWCARVSADGKTLDPTGIRLTKGQGLKDRPRVASDGKGFLVVWEDMRNDKDPSTVSGQGWDVFGARVSGDGKVLDADGLPIAGGEHNQARPGVAFAKGNYYVVWQAYDNGYSVLGTRVSTDGKVLDGKGVEIAAYADRPGWQAYNPAVGACGDDLLVTGIAEPQWNGAGRQNAFRRAVDAASGQPLGKAPTSKSSERDKPHLAQEFQRQPALALSPSEALVVVRVQDAERFGCSGRICRYSKTGELVGEEKGVAFGAFPAAGHTPRYALAFDGKNFLLAADHVVGMKKGETPRMEIRGWHIAPDGKLLDDAAKGFAIAADAGKDQTLPALAAGPEGVCLVVYSEVRGPDDIKVLARVVK